MMQDLKTSLDDMAQAEYADAPVSTVDIGKARADGRRRMRTARLAPIGAGVAVVAACALVVNALGGTSPARSGTPDAGAAAARQFTGTDPLTRIAQFGYLPDGFQTATTSRLQYYGNLVTAKTKPEVPFGSGKSTTLQPVMLQLTQSDTDMPIMKYETKKAVTVAGAKQAFLVTNPGDDPSIPDDLSLHWQSASGTWYILGDDYQIHGAELEAMLIKVAGQVTAADDDALPLPLHIEGLPKDAVVDNATLDDPIVVGTGGVSLRLEFSSPGGSFQITALPVGWPASQTDPTNRSVSMATPVGSPPPQTIVDHSVCKDSEGLHVCIQYNGASNDPDPLASVGGAKGLLSRTTSLGTNPANWTTHVVN